MIANATPNNAYSLTIASDVSGIRSTQRSETLTAMLRFSFAPLRWLGIGRVVSEL